VFKPGTYGETKPSFDLLSWNFGGAYVGIFGSGAYFISKKKHGNPGWFWGVDVAYDLILVFFLSPK
jgi:hypothetical protein